MSFLQLPNDMCVWCHKPSGPKRALNFEWACPECAQIREKVFGKPVRAIVIPTPMEVDSRGCDKCHRTKPTHRFSSNQADTCLKCESKV